MWSARWDPTAAVKYWYQSAIEGSVKAIGLAIICLLGAPAMAAEATIAPPPRVEPAQDDAELLSAAAEGCDTVFHCAARIQLTDRDADELRRINVGGTEAAIAAARSAGARLVHLSSIEALDPEPRDQPVDEQRPLVREGPMAYADTKVEAERAVRRASEEGLSTVILQPTAMIGPEDHRPSLAGRFLLDVALTRLPALVTGGFDWVDVRDVAAAAIAASDSSSEKSPSGPINNSTPGN